MLRAVWQPTSARTVTSRVTRSRVASLTKLIAKYKVKDKKLHSWFDPLCDFPLPFSRLSTKESITNKKGGASPQSSCSPSGPCAATVQEHDLKIKNPLAAKRDD